MWFKTIFRRKRPTTGSLRSRPMRADRPLFDEPFLRRIERLSLQAQRTLRGNPISGEHPGRRQLPATVFSDHRPYSSGDDLRYVDWGAYARQNQLLVRLGEMEQEVQVHLLIDTSQSMLIGNPPRLRLAQQLVGTLGYLALAHNDRVRVAPIGATGRQIFGPAHGKRHAISMLRFVERIEPQPAAAGLAAAVAAYARHHPQGGLLVICSDLLTTDTLAEVLHPLEPPRWQLLVLHLLDQRDLTPDLRGALELEDSESGQRLSLLLDEETLRAYKQHLATWREELLRACERRGATYVPMMSHWPLEQQVVPYVRLRRLLG